MRCVFQGQAAFLGRIAGETRCAFWTDEPTEHDFDPERLIEIDLGRTPAAASAGEIAWDEVDVDDCFAGPTGNVAGTTLGPRWPEMQLAGMVWLSERFLARLPAARRPPCPPEGAEARGYEFQSVVYATGTDDPRAGTRYQGHHAKILEERGPLARVAVFPPGSSLRPAVAHTMWIDLSSAEQCDAGPRSLTEIGTGDRRKEGALFLVVNRLVLPANPQPGEVA
ncbi:MAG: hypothetical protein JO257_24080 [Deltaproteobacteria bacterium]|nr:hypothetical protein [Deltaproteobacteria bacterium]